MTAQVDLTEFAQASRRIGARCSVAKITPVLTEDQVLTLTGALASSYSAATIATVVSGWGFPIGTSTMQRHRRHECSCGKDQS